MPLTPLHKASKAELLKLIEYLTRKQLDRARFVQDLEHQLTDMRVRAAMDEMDAINAKIMALQELRMKEGMVGLPLLENLLESQGLRRQWSKLHELTNKLMQLGKYEVTEVTHAETT